jgi:hypothetical protein
MTFKQFITLIGQLCFHHGVIVTIHYFKPYQLVAYITVRIVLQMALFLDWHSLAKQNNTLLIISNIVMMQLIY